MQIIYLTLLSIVLFNTNNLVAQPVKEKAIQLLKTEMKENQIPGAQLVVIKNNQIILSEAMGLANVEFSVPVTDSTTFSINSVTKGKEHPAVAAVGGGRAGVMIYPKDNLAIILFTNLGARSIESTIDKIAKLYF